jgi:Glycosyl transferases group 1
MDGRPPRDPYDIVGNEDPRRILEFLEQLQGSVDAADRRIVDLERRVQKLLADRETLRRRLDETRSEIDRLRSHPAGRLASRLSRKADRTEEPAPSEATEARASVKGRWVVATILDEISDACWSPEFENVRLSRSKWREQLERSAPDVLFVESAFAGAAGTWTRVINHFGSPHQDLVSLVDTCRSMQIPTVFWNKEDPVNYPWFIGSASLFDHVFTVDGDQIPSYRDDLGHDRIHLLTFAAQPTMHHPPSSGTLRPQSGSVAFAGSYYARKHAQRRLQMDMLLPPAVQFGLHIYDRMQRTDDPRFAWPPLLRACVVGSVPYTEMGDIYRSYGAFANVNTVVDSPTMCARRVFELVACATPTVSGPSLAIETGIPAGVVRVVHSPEEARSAYATLLADGAATDVAAGTEWVGSGQTYRHRWETILSTVVA